MGYLRTRQYLSKKTINFTSVSILFKVSVQEVKVNWFNLAWKFGTWSMKQAIEVSIWNAICLVNEVFSNRSSPELVVWIGSDEKWWATGVRWPGGPHADFKVTTRTNKLSSEQYYVFWFLQHTETSQFCYQGNIMFNCGCFAAKFDTLISSQ